MAPRKSKSPFVRWVGRVVLSPWTETFMLVAILANVAVMASATWGMGAARQTLLDRLNMAFTAVYLAELALKVSLITLLSTLPVSGHGFCPVLDGWCLRPVSYAISRLLRQPRCATPRFPILAKPPPLTHLRQLHLSLSRS